MLTTCLGDVWLSVADDRVTSSCGSTMKRVFTGQTTIRQQLRHFLHLLITQLAHHYFSLATSLSRVTRTTGDSLSETSSLRENWSTALLRAAWLK